MMAVRTLCVLLLAAALVTAAGCGGGDGDEDATTAPTESAPSRTAPPGVTVSMKEYSFSPDLLELRRGATIVVTNDGQIAHNLTVEKGPNPDRESRKLAGTPTFNPGGDQKLELDLPPGTYALACTVPGHREQGMKGTLTVK